MVVNRPLDGKYSDRIKQEINDEQSPCPLGAEELGSCSTVFPEHHPLDRREKDTSCFECGPRIYLERSVELLVDRIEPVDPRRVR